MQPILNSKDVFKMTYPEQLHELSKQTHDLADYWNRAAVERCDIFKAIQLKKYDDLDFLSDMLYKHCKISIEIVHSIRDLLLEMNAYACCRREHDSKC